jgi:hypothetical protein
MKHTEDDSHAHITCEFEHTCIIVVGGVGGYKFMLDGRIGEFELFY